MREWYKNGDQSRQNRPNSMKLCNMISFYADSEIGWGCEIESFICHDFNVDLSPFSQFFLRKWSLFSVKKVAKNKFLFKYQFVGFLCRTEIAATDFLTFWPKFRLLAAHVFHSADTSVSFVQKIIRENCVFSEHIIHKKMSNTCLSYVREPNVSRTEVRFAVFGEYTQKNQHHQQQQLQHPSYCKRQWKFV